MNKVPITGNLILIMLITIQNKHRKSW